MQRELADIISLDRFRKLTYDRASVDPIIVWWKCRVWTCLTRVGVTPTAMFAFEIFCAELKRRGQQPLDPDDIMLCAACAPIELERRRHR